MNLTNIPSAKEIRESYEGENIKSFWEEKIAAKVSEIREKVLIANRGGEFSSVVGYEAKSNAERSYVRRRFEEKGFKLYNTGAYGTLVISWDEDVPQAPPKRP